MAKQRYRKGKRYIGGGGGASGDAGIIQNTDGGGGGGGVFTASDESIPRGGSFGQSSFLSFSLIFLLFLVLKMHTIFSFGKIRSSKSWYFIT